MYKIDRQLATVKFVSYIPGDARLAMERQTGRPVDVNTKHTFGCKMWVPWPVDDKTDQYLPEKMDPEEQGLEWATREVKRLRPEGLEVLAVIGIEFSGIMESSILNQPELGVSGEVEKPKRLSNLVEV